MAATGAAMLVASFVYAPWALDESGPTLCPFRLLTGLPCPGCGLTRSFCALAQGDVRHAIAFHFLGPVLFLGLLAGVPAMLFQGLTRRPIALVGTVLYSREVGYVLAAVLIVNHATQVVTQAWSGQLWQGVPGSLIGQLAHLIMQ
ncbi:MAG: hypothetical protein A3H97_08430 [Acidobacteria bacterium RIFCSPLOWO2_02_FULL_65_29]|nr:MAG: hypothetical protein A3H97_08430 [Acidobacteria bacterium RIFCSPLOWO2_02_FULL_65_29]